MKVKRSFQIHSYWILYYFHKLIGNDLGNFLVRLYTLINKSYNNFPPLKLFILSEPAMPHGHLHHSCPVISYFILVFWAMSHSTILLQWSCWTRHKDRSFQDGVVWTEAVLRDTWGISCVDKSCWCPGQLIRRSNQWHQVAIISGWNLTLAYFKGLLLREM